MTANVFIPKVFAPVQRNKVKPGSTKEFCQILYGGVSYAIGAIVISFYSQGFPDLSSLTS